VITVPRWLLCSAGVATACLVLGACAAPVPSYPAYRHAALITATAMVSSLATAEVSARIVLRSDNLFDFADDNVTNAENDANSVSSTFGSRQPPDARSMAVQQKMSKAISQATSALSSLRIALRQGSQAGLKSALAAVAKALRQFLLLQQALR
jgi:hypothetical protein